MCLYKFRILGEYLHSSHTYVKYKSDLHRKKLLYIWLESVFFQRNILLMKSFFFFLSLSDVYPGLILKSGAARRIAIAYNRMCANEESGNLEKMFINMAHGQTGQFRTDTECVCSLTEVQIGGGGTQASSPSVPLPPQLTKCQNLLGIRCSASLMPLQPWKEFPSCPASRKVSLEPCFSQLFLNPWAPCRWTRLLVKTLLCGLYD